MGSIPTRSILSYCGGTDQVISSPIVTGNGSLTTGSPDDRTGLASNRTHAAPAVTLGGRAKTAVWPPGTKPRRFNRPSFRRTEMSTSSEARFSMRARV
ncbi:MAG: hypothetical protein QOK27_2541 [Gemmatimonadales bacterium]|nr:hypothetical protein [Gemmatimonadales bacterium]